MWTAPALIGLAGDVTSFLDVSRSLPEQGAGLSGLMICAISTPLVIGQGLAVGVMEAPCTRTTRDVPGSRLAPHFP
ncbi:hypothetical protein [Pseudomonas sp. R5(2019)]|uniref:hypothetical protein n=1 Tax=Pseudomonas sp. R5(2019) TaxID=2697566 RepID=UPI0014128E0C|nr:hypothetical protein [Pseudomonas sp. R5(2019)]NBA98616.1 hypothetical protein [Pseudomonas sp. R5(2019)]